MRSSWPAPLLLACAAAVHHALLAGGVPYWRDAHLSNVPVHVFFARALQAGQLPAWWPYDGGGSPLLPIPSLELFHPSALLYLVASPLPALVLHGLLATWLAMGGVWVLARELGQSRPAALAAAVLYGASGYLVCLIEQTFMLVAAGTLPWVAWSLLVAHRRGGRWRALPAAALALQLLAGDPQAALLAAGAGAALLAAARGLDRRAAGLLVGSTALAVALAAVVVLPALLGQGFTERGAALATADRWPLELRHLAGLVLPLRHGPLDFVDSTAFGLAGLALAGAALAGGRRSRPMAALGLLAVAGLWLALGDGAGLNRLARAVVPFWSSLRYPIKSLELSVFALALLAGAGLDALGGAARRRALAGAGLAAAAGLGIAGAAGQLAEPGLWLPALALAALVLAAAAAGPARLRWVAAAAVAGQALVVAWPLFPTTDASYYDEPPLAAALRAQGVGPDGPAFDRVFGPALAPEDEAWVDRAAAGGGPSQLSGLWGLPTLSAYGIGASGRLRSLFTAPGVTPAAARRVQGLLGVGFLVGPRSALAPGAEVLAADPTFDLVLSRAARSLPRAYLVHRARGVAGPAEARQELLGGGLQPGREVVLEGEVPAEQARRPDQLAVPAAVSHPTPTSVRIEAAAPWPGWVVLNEAWFPGWTATVDGQAAPLRIANLAMRAVEVPAGRHLVELRYATPGLGAGAWVSLAALLAWGLWWWRARAAGPPAP